MGNKKTVNNGNQVIEVQATEIVDATTQVAVAMGGNLLEQQDLGSYYSVVATTKAEKIAVFNAINNPTDTISNNINKTIPVKDILIEMVELVSEETGEIDVAPRIIVIDEKGKTYSTVSFGMLGAFKRIINMFGEPSTWEEPLKCVVKQVSTKNGSMLTVELAE